MADWLQGLKDLQHTMEVGVGAIEAGLSSAVNNFGPTKNFQQTMGAGIGAIEAKLNTIANNFGPAKETLQPSTGATILADGSLVTPEGHFYATNPHVEMRIPLNRQPGVATGLGATPQFVLNTNDPGMDAPARSGPGDLSNDRGMDAPGRGGPGDLSNDWGMDGSARRRTTGPAVAPARPDDGVARAIHRTGNQGPAGVEIVPLDDGVARAIHRTGNRGPAGVEIVPLDDGVARATHHIGNQGPAGVEIVKPGVQDMSRVMAALAVHGLDKPPTWTAEHKQGLDHPPGHPPEGNRVAAAAGMAAAATGRA